MSSLIFVIGRYLQNHPTLAKVLPGQGEGFVCCEKMPAMVNQARLK
jgi:hypothetical protein